MPAVFYLRPLGQFLICSPSGEVDQLERKREEERRELCAVRSLKSFRPVSR